MSLNNVKIVDPNRCLYSTVSRGHYEYVKAEIQFFLDLSRNTRYSEHSVIYELM